jgi:hypothetical protein
LQVDTNDLTNDRQRNQGIASVLNVATQKGSTSGGIDMLSRGIWLLDLRSSLPFLSQICGAADSAGVPYRLLFLEQAPEWIAYGEWK